MSWPRFRKPVSTPLGYLAADGDGLVILDPVGAIYPILDLVENGPGIVAEDIEHGLEIERRPYGPPRPRPKIFIPAARAAA